MGPHCVAFTTWFKIPIRFELSRWSQLDTEHVQVELSHRKSLFRTIMYLLFAFCLLPFAFCLSYSHTWTCCTGKKGYHRESESHLGTHRDNLNRLRWILRVAYPHIRLEYNKPNHKITDGPGHNHMSVVAPVKSWRTSKSSIKLWVHPHIRMKILSLSPKIKLLNKFYTPQTKIMVPPLHEVDHMIENKTQRWRDIIADVEFITFPSSAQSDTRTIPIKLKFDGILLDRKN